MKANSFFFVFLIFYSNALLATDEVCIAGVSFSFSTIEWKKNKTQLTKRKDKLIKQQIYFNETNSNYPNITPITDQDAQSGLGEQGAWYLGGVDSGLGPAEFTTKNGYSIYEATSNCGVEYKNGISGTGVCYNARVIGKASDVEINSAAISFEEIKEHNGIYKTKSIADFRRVIYSVTEGCKQYIPHKK